MRLHAFTPAVAVAVFLLAGTATWAAGEWIDLDQQILSFPAWERCGGSSAPGSGKMQIEKAFAILLCVGRTDKKNAIAALQAIATSFAQASDRNPASAFPAQAQAELAIMKVYAENGERSNAAVAGNRAVGTQRFWDGHDLPEEHLVYWDMLSDDMQRVLAAHGAVRADNRDARPQQWKVDAERDVWVYKSGAAIVTTYIFTNGKLTETLKP